MLKLKKRIVVFGDTHVVQKEKKLWNEVREDINSLHPDHIFMVGDLSGDMVGDAAGLRLALDTFKGFDCPFETIIGNHDLEGKSFDSDEANLQSMMQDLGRETPYFSIDLDPFTIIGLSNTKHRQNTVNKNELVTGAEQLEWFQSELKRVSYRPVIVLSHAPILGSGLINLPELHVRVGNCFMNQNQQPGDLMTAVYHNPNVLFWFSGHSHMSHIYDHSITARLGCHFIHCGVVSRHASRDGNLHTRIFDIYDDHFKVKTFDHSLRKIDDDLEYRENHSIETYFSYRKSLSEKRHIPRDLKTSSHKVTENFQKKRIMWLSDMHIENDLSAVQHRVLDWCRFESIHNDIDFLVLSGDMSEGSKAEKWNRLLEGLAVYIPTYLLMGGIEQGELPQWDFLRKVIEKDSNQIDGLPENYVFLYQPNKEIARESILFLKSIKHEQMLVFARYPVSEIFDEIPKWLTKLKITWICGSTFLNKHQKFGSLVEYTSGSIDACLAKGSPEILMLEVSNSELGLEVDMKRLQIPSKRFKI